MDLKQEVNKFLNKTKKEKLKKNMYSPNDIVDHETYIMLVLRNRKLKIVGLVKCDLEDLELLKKYKWHLHQRYASAHTERGHLRMHEFLIGKKKGFVCHHKNNEPLDNRKENIYLIESSKHMKKGNHIIKRTTPDKILADKFLDKFHRELKETKKLCL